MLVKVNNVLLNGILKKKSLPFTFSVKGKVNNVLLNGILKEKCLPFTCCVKGKVNNVFTEKKSFIFHL